MNNVVLLGRMANDPEVKKTQNDVSVLRFSVAVERPYQKDKEKETDFIDCVAWRKVAEFIGKHFGKGDPIVLSGSIRTSVYEDKNGEKRKSVDVHISDVNFVPAPKREQQTVSKAEKTSTAYTETFVELSDDEDVPF